MTTKSHPSNIFSRISVKRSKKHSCATATTSISTQLFAKNNIAPNDEDPQDESKSSKSSSNVVNRVGKIGNRMMKRISRSKEKDTKGKDDAAATTTTSSAGKKKKISKNSFLSVFSSPSEATLNAALKRQQALQSYVSGTDSTMNDDLPPELQLDSEEVGDDDDDDNLFGSDLLADALNSIEENLTSVRKEITSVRFNQNDPEEESKRLNEIRRNLEVRRKRLLLEEQRRKRERDIQKQLTKERQRQAAANAKIKKLKREEKELKKRKERERLRLGLILTNTDSDDGEGEEDEESSKKGVMDVFSSAQSFWDSKFKSEKEWVVVGPKTMISPGEVVPVNVAGIDLLVIGSLDGAKVHCIANSCPHLGTPLETGPLQRRPCANEVCNTVGDSLTGGLRTTSTKNVVRDGFEECIVCPLHQTAFALETGEVNGEWCPYPPVIGKVVGTIKPEAKLPTFELRTRGKNVEVRINSCLPDVKDKKDKKDKK